MVRFQKPKFIPLLCTVLTLLILLSLGTWQVQRLFWKQGILNKIHAQMVEEEIVLPLEHYDVAALEYRKVTLTGHPLYDKELFLYQSLAGKSGYDLITPFRLADGSMVLVDRGWIPMDMRQTYLDTPKAEDETLTVNGILLRGEQQGMFTPENNISKNVWFWVDIDQVARLNEAKVPPLYVRAVGANDVGEYPIKGSVTVNIRNDHLQYALTWYMLAVAVIVIFVLYHRKDTRQYTSTLH